VDSQPAPGSDYRDRGKSIKQVVSEPFTVKDYYSKLSEYWNFINLPLNGSADSELTIKGFAPGELPVGD